MKKQSYQSNAASYFREHSSIFLFIIILFLMGVIFGAIIVNSMGMTQKENLFNYLSQFLGQVLDGKVSGDSNLFLQSFFETSKFIGMMWILGISIIGLPIILILLFLKGMVVGFTVGFLVSQLGLKGFLLAFVSILPQNLITIPVFIVMAALSVIFSLRMIKRQFMQKPGLSAGPFFKRYILALAAACVFISAASGIEAFVSPWLMKSVLHSFSIK